MVNAQPRIGPTKWNAKTSLGFRNIDGYPNLGWTTRPYNNKQKSELAELWTLLLRLTTVKLKVSQMKHNTSTLQENWKMCGTGKWRWYQLKLVRSVVPKGWLQRMEDLEIREREETIQIKAILKSAKLLRSILEILGDLLSLKLQWETICKSLREKHSK